MSAPLLAKKLRVPEEGKAVVLNAPPGMLALVGLDAPPDGLTVLKRAGKDADFILAFVHDMAELEKLGPKAIASGRHDCMMWLCWPKKTGPLNTDVTRDTLWARLAAWNMTGVANVSVDDTWSGFRARPAKR